MKMLGLMLVVALVVFVAARRDDPERRMRERLKRRLRSGLAKPERKISWKL